MPPITRRHRSSLPTSPGADDISHLTLMECRERLARNERVLNTALFNPPSPTHSLSTSPTSVYAGQFMSSPQQIHSSTQAGPSRPPPPPHDPVKEKLLLTRQALLAREQELLLYESTDQVAKLDFNNTSPTLGSPTRSNGYYRRGSAGPGSNSGKAIAMEYMRQKDAERGHSGLILPLDETLQLADRDFENQTAQTFSALAVSRGQNTPDTPTKSSKSRTPGDIDPTDENARAQHLARLKAFMSYKPDPDLDDDGEDEFGFDFDDPDADGAEGEYADERIGSGLVDGYGVKREPGTGEEVDGLGEDDERWLDGNDEYEGMGGVGPGAEAGLERAR